MCNLGQGILERGEAYNVPYKVDTARGRDCLKC